MNVLFALLLAVGMVAGDGAGAAAGKSALYSNARELKQPSDWAHFRLYLESVDLLPFVY